MPRLETKPCGANTRITGNQAASDIRLALLPGACGAAGASKGYKRWRQWHEHERQKT